MLMLAFLVLTSPKAANANADRSQLHKYQKEFYHADGYIKAIGHAASHTIYSPNPQVRGKWKGALRYLEHRKANAQHHIYILRRPAVTHIQYSQNYWINKQIQVAEIIGHSALSSGGRDPWPNCPDPIFNGASSWQDTVNCENGGNWYDSPGYYRCGLQFDPNWELRYGRLCP